MTISRPDLVERHRNLARRHREEDRAGIAEWHDRMADCLERLTESDRVLDVAERDLVGSWKPSPDDPAP